MNRVNELIIGSGLSQKQVALEIGVSRPTVSDWVNNKKDPRGENLHKLAKLFNVDWREILVTEQKHDADSTSGILPPPPPPPPASGLTEADLAKIAELIQPVTDAPRTVEARIVSFGMDKLPKEDRERLLAMIRALYSNRPELFDAKGDTADDTRL